MSSKNACPPSTEDGEWSSVPSPIWGESVYFGSTKITLGKSGVGFQFEVELQTIKSPELVPSHHLRVPARHHGEERKEPLMVNAPADIALVEPVIGELLVRETRRGC